MNQLIASVLKSINNYRLQKDLWIHLVLRRQLTTSVYYANVINRCMCLCASGWEYVLTNEMRQEETSARLLKMYRPTLTAIINVGTVMQNHALETMSLIPMIIFLHGREAESVIITVRICTYEHLCLKMPLFEKACLAKGERN